MIKISADKDADQREIYNKIVLCPICGQKLTDISYVNGVVILRVKCRRCKNYINVDIVGNSHISVEDYAAAMIDELEHPQHHQERFTIGY
jgi:C4-type Zn-finger protein